VIRHEVTTDSQNALLICFSWTARCDISCEWRLLFPGECGKNQTPVCDKAVVRNCNSNVNPRSHVSGEIRELQPKMEQLISLVNKTLSSTPRPPGKWNLSGFLKMDRSFYNQCFVNLPLGFILFVTVPVYSCKEQHEKYK